MIAILTTREIVMLALTLALIVAWDVIGPKFIAVLAGM